MHLHSYFAKTPHVVCLFLRKQKIPPKIKGCRSPEIRPSFTRNKAKVAHATLSSQILTNDTKGTGAVWLRAKNETMKARHFHHLCSSRFWD